MHTDVIIASGAKVIADAARAKEVTSFHRKAVAIEMEAAGVAAAASAIPNTGFLIVKAISDYADDEKDDSWHRMASRSAAEFAGAVVGSLISDPS